MKNKRLIAIVSIVVIAVVGIVVWAFAANSEENPEATPSASNSSTAIPLDMETSEPTAEPKPEPVVTQTATPSAEPVEESSELPPSLAEDIEEPNPALLGDRSAPEGGEERLTEEDKEARRMLEQTIPVLANYASPEYKSKSELAKQLLKKDVITKNLAKNFLSGDYTQYEKDLNASGLVTQTKWIRCALESQTPQRVLETGQVVCWITRQMVTSDGTDATSAELREAGNIAGYSQKVISQVLVDVVKEKGKWKIDGVTFGNA